MLGRFVWESTGSVSSRGFKPILRQPRLLRSTISERPGRKRESNTHIPFGRRRRDESMKSKLGRLVLLHLRRQKGSVAEVVQARRKTHEFRLELLRNRRRRVAEMQLSSVSK